MKKEYSTIFHTDHCMYSPNAINATCIVSKMADINYILR